MRKSGVKFGLIGSASSLKKGGGKGSARPIGSKPPPRRPPPGATAAFATNSDDEEEGPRDDPSGVAAVNKRLAAISAKQEKQAKKEYEEALEADPSVFDYDRVYDGMQESRESKAAAATIAHEKEKRQPKYIGNLLKQAKMRAVESDRIFERKLQKEREEQDKVEGEATMKFVTSAYKKKLMEQKKWELQQQLEDEREQRNDVTKTGMSGFYSNLITKNIAMGGDVEKSANSAFTAGSKRHTATEEYEIRQGDTKAGVKARSQDTGNEDVEDRHATEERNPGGESLGKQGDDTAPTARMVDPRACATRESGDPSVRTAEEAVGGDRSVAGKVRRRQIDADEDGDGGGKRVRAGEEEGMDEGDVDGGASSRLGGRGEHRTQDVEGASEAERRETTESMKAQKAAAAKAKREAAVKAARERFLARKKAS